MLNEYLICTSIGSDSIPLRKVTGTIVLTMTYGFVGQWGEGFVNTTASSTLQCDFENQNIVKIVGKKRITLISSLRESIQSDEQRRRFGVHAQRIFDLYHVISETQIFIP